MGRLEAILVLTSVLHFVDADSVLCPNGYRTVMGKLCVRAINEAMNFPDAVKNCERLGGQVWKPDCLADQTAVLEATGVENAWLSVYFPFEEEDFVTYPSNEPLLFTRWNEDQTDTTDFTNNAFVNADGSWNASGSWEMVPSICSARPLVDGCFEPDVTYRESIGFSSDSEPEFCSWVCYVSPACTYYVYDDFEETCRIYDVPFRSFKNAPWDQWGTPYYRSNDVVPAGLIVPATSPHDCQQACQDDSRCQSFTYHYAREECTLTYTRTIFRATTGHTYPPTLVSGPRHCNPPCGGGVCHVESDGYGAY